MNRQIVLFGLLFRIEICKKPPVAPPVQIPTLCAKVYPTPTSFNIEPSMMLPIAPDIAQERPCKRFWHEGATPGPSTADLWNGKSPQEHYVFVHKQG